VYARHFVASIKVEVVNKLRPAARSANSGELTREVVEVVRIVVSDSDLEALIAKTTKHLSLIDNAGANDIVTK